MLLFVIKSSKCFLRRRIWRRMANVSDPVPYLPSPWPPKEGICKEDLSMGLVNFLHPFFVLKSGKCIWCRKANVSDLPALSAKSMNSKRRHL